MTPASQLPHQITGSGVAAALTPGGRSGMDGVHHVALALSGDARILEWDRRNTGAAEVRIAGESEQEMWADDLAELLRHAGLAPAILMGGSAGARVSLLTAVRHPDVVSGLILWSISGGHYGSQVLGYQNHVPYIQAAQRGGMHAVAETPFFEERIAANPANRAILATIDPEELIRVMKAWSASYELRDGCPVIGLTADQLRSIRAPTLIVAGNDDIHPEIASDAVHEAISGSTLIDPVWTRDEWMQRYLQLVPESVFDLYPRLVPAIRDFLREA